MKKKKPSSEKEEKLGELLELHTKTPSDTHMYAHRHTHTHMHSFHLPHCAANHIWVKGGVGGMVVVVVVEVGSVTNPPSVLRSLFHLNVGVF